ncbi:hypothetical protein M885DRAFT_212831 [Pelagophyceae sp. CCMP2097]|nr:hypothetical protein M885DRAFT_212831 [Pelagophyceae sp. CCMP2097]
MIDDGAFALALGRALVGGASNVEEMKDVVRALLTETVQQQLWELVVDAALEASADPTLRTHYADFSFRNARPAKRAAHAAVETDTAADDDDDDDGFSDGGDAASLHSFTALEAPPHDAAPLHEDAAHASPLDQALQGKGAGDAPTAQDASNAAASSAALVALPPAQAAPTVRSTGRRLRRERAKAAAHRRDATVEALPRRCADAAARRPAARLDEEDRVGELSDRGDRFQKSPGERFQVTHARSASAPPMRPIFGDKRLSGFGDERVSPPPAAHEGAPGDDNFGNVSFANGSFANSFANGGEDFSEDDASDDDDGGDSPNRTARRVRQAFHARHRNVFCAWKLPAHLSLHPPASHPAAEAYSERVTSLVDVARGWSALHPGPSSSLDSESDDDSASSMSSDQGEEPTIECFTVDDDACCRADGLLNALDARGGAFAFADQCARANAVLEVHMREGILPTRGTMARVEAWLRSADVDAGLSDALHADAAQLEHQVSRLVTAVLQLGYARHHARILDGRIVCVPPPPPLTPPGGGAAASEGAAPSAPDGPKTSLVAAGVSDRLVADVRRFARWLAIYRVDEFLQTASRHEKVLPEA